MTTTTTHPATVLVIEGDDASRMLVTYLLEAADHSRLLALLGCDEIQGYLLSKPLPADEFEARFLQGHGGAPAS